MPNPGVEQLHVNRPLTDVSLAWIQDQDEFIADKVFGRIPSKTKSDMYWKYGKADARRTRATLRAPGAETPGIQWSMSTDSFFINPYGVHHDVMDQEKANADSSFDLEADAAEMVTNDLLIKRDVDWCNSFFKTGVWGTEYTGIASGTPSSTQFLKWDVDGSDLLVNTTDWFTDFKRDTTKPVNFIVFGADVWKVILNHPVILDRIKFTQTGQITRKIVADFLGVKNIYIPYATEATAPEANDADLDDAAASYNFIANPKGVLFGYANPTPSKKKPSAGYTFTWKGYSGNAEGVAISSWYEKKTRSTRVEGEITYAFKVVAEDCGVWLNDVVA